ncbi:MAG: phosphate acyltransferase PlsX [Solirubrobacteraceae bacterium]|nr:phosphate acyltransferase PlsX [Solirubrobacteraceae bacterium]
MSRPVTVAVDATGADLGPAEVARGAAAAASTGIRVILFGPIAELSAALPGGAAENVELVDAPISIAKAADPARAVRQHPHASIVQAVRAVKEGVADAFVAGGATGAALAAGMGELGRAEGIRRPAIAAQIPLPGAEVTLLDVGANATVRPEHLEQFAFMGRAFSRAVVGVEHPRVALLSNGEEATRGTDLIRDVHERLSGHEGLGFIGSIDGSSIPTGVADVIVTDGFTGNVALKAMEGVSTELFHLIKRTMMASNRGKVGGLMLRGPLRGLRDTLDPELQGGAYLLGLSALGVITHGRFTHVGFEHAVLRAARAVREDLLSETRKDLEAAGALRPARRRSAQPDSVVAHDA